jgi:hypothetical protein
MGAGNPSRSRGFSVTAPPLANTERGIRQTAQVSGGRTIRDDGVTVAFEGVRADQ